MREDEATLESIVHGRCLATRMLSVTWAALQARPSALHALHRFSGRVCSFKDCLYFAKVNVFSSNPAMDSFDGKLVPQKVAQRTNCKKMQTHDLFTPDTISLQRNL